MMVKSAGDATRSRMTPAATAAPLAKRFDAAACRPKKVAKKSEGITRPSKFCQAFPVKPAPRPCQIRQPKARINAAGLPIKGRRSEVSANPKKGSRSWIVAFMTGGRNLFTLFKDVAVKICGS